MENDINDPEKKHKTTQIAIIILGVIGSFASIASLVYAIYIYESDTNTVTLSLGKATVAVFILLGIIILTLIILVFLIQNENLKLSKEHQNILIEKDIQVQNLLKEKYYNKETYLNGQSKISEGFAYLNMQKIENDTNSLKVRTKAFSEFVVLFASGCSELLGCECSVVIRIAQKSKHENKVFLKKAWRGNSGVTMNFEKSDKKLHSLYDNSAYRYFWENSQSQKDVYMNNNLPLSEGYKDSDFDTYGQTDFTNTSLEVNNEDKVNNWKMPYSSRLDARIRPYPSLHDKEGLPQIEGFLSILAKEPNVFDDYHKKLILGTCDGLYLHLLEVTRDWNTRKKQGKNPHSTGKTGSGGL